MHVRLDHNTLRVQHLQLYNRCRWGNQQDMTPTVRHLLSRCSATRCQHWLEAPTISTAANQLNASVCISVSCQLCGVPLVPRCSGWASLYWVHSASGHQLLAHLRAVQLRAVYVGAVYWDRRTGVSYNQESLGRAAVEVAETLEKELTSAVFCFYSKNLFCKFIFYL